MASRTADKRRAKKKHQRAVARAEKKAAAKQHMVYLTEEQHLARQADAMRRRLEETKALIDEVKPQSKQVFDEAAAKAIRMMLDKTKALIAKKKKETPTK